MFGFSKTQADQVLQLITLSRIIPETYLVYKPLKPGITPMGGLTKYQLPNKVMPPVG